MTDEDVDHVISYLRDFEGYEEGAQIVESLRHLAAVLVRFVSDAGGSRYWALTEEDNGYRALTIDAGVEISEAEAAAIKRVTDGRTYYR